MSRIAAIVVGTMVLTLSSCHREPGAPAQETSSRILLNPVRGLSSVEAFPVETPDHVTLSPNPALVDGNPDASAGIDIGTGPTVIGDSAFRDVGAQFADATTSVDLVCIRVDRALPASIAAAYSWTVFSSTDNIGWSAVALSGPAVFVSLHNTFELSIPVTQARYLKVVTRPLAAEVTTDPTYAEVFVTEVLLFRTLH